MVPRILEVHHEVELLRGTHKEALGKAVDAILRTGSRPKGTKQEIFILSAKDDPRTTVLPAPVQNDLRSKVGVRAAFTQSALR